MREEEEEGEEWEGAEGVGEKCTWSLGASDSDVGPLQTSPGGRRGIHVGAFKKGGGAKFQKGGGATRAERPTGRAHRCATRRRTLRTRSPRGWTAHAPFPLLRPSVSPHLLPSSRSRQHHPRLHRHPPPPPCTERYRKRGYQLHTMDRG